MICDVRAAAGRTLPLIIKDVMSRPTLGLFGARRSASAPAAPAKDDRFAGLTPVERAMAENLLRGREASPA
jgi:hypothetical protein